MTDNRGWTPDRIAEWQRVVRDLVAYVLATFLFVFGALTVRDSTIIGAMFGAGLILLGLPITARLDRALRNNNDDDSRDK